MKRYETVKSRLPTLEYLDWHRTDARGARWDLSREPILAPLEFFDSSNHGKSPRDDVGYDTQSADALRLKLRERIAHRYGLSPEHIVLTSGSSEGLAVALMALARAGDDIVVERPACPRLHRCAELMGLRVRRLERKAEEDWKILPARVAQILSPKTRAIFLSNFHDPSGVGVESEVLAQIGDMALRVGAVVFVAEQYLDYHFDAHDMLAWSPACLTLEHAISCSSLGHAWGFPELRVGWLVTRQLDVSRDLDRAAHYMRGPVSSASLPIACNILENAPQILGQAERVARRGRGVVERWLQKEKRIRWIAPAAGCIGLLLLPTAVDDRVFAALLREAFDTQVVPGTFFEAPGTIRIHFGQAVEPLEAALAHISAALDEIHRR